jgi:hypothetical protein
MKQNAITAFVSCAAIVALSLSSRAAEVKPPATQPATAPVAVEEQDPLKFSEEADAKAKALRSVIEQDIKGLRGHPWAGRYYFGDGLGANVSLWLAPKAGFLYQWHGCLGLYDRNYGGAVEEPNGTIRLSFELDGSRIAGEYIPVRWGERRYLVTKDEMEGFCEDVNSGREPRSGMHGSVFLRRGDEERRVDGLPSVPAEYRGLLKPKLESK